MRSRKNPMGEPAHLQNGEEWSHRDIGQEFGGPMNLKREEKTLN